MNLVYAWCVERVPSDKLEEWVTMLEAPLPNEDSHTPPSEQSLEAEGAMFMAAMKQVGG